ncbi:hypothetical protein RFI_23352, partial [Reticulomyxa filosa]
EQLSKEWEKIYQEKQWIEKEKRELKEMSRELIRKNRIFEMKQTKMKLWQRSKALDENESLLNASSKHCSPTKADDSKKWIHQFQRLEIQNIRESLQSQSNSFPHNDNANTNINTNTNTNTNAAVPNHSNENNVNPSVSLLPNSNPSLSFLYQFDKLKPKKLEALEDRIVTLLENPNKHRRGNEIEREVNRKLKMKQPNVRNRKKWISQSARQSRRPSQLLKQKQLAA